MANQYEKMMNSPIGTKFIDALTPAAVEELHKAYPNVGNTALPKGGAFLGRRDGATGFWGLGYSPCERPPPGQVHVPPAQVVGNASWSCEHTCPECSVSCEGFPLCPIHRDKAHFVIGNDSYCLEGGLMFIFHGANIPHGLAAAEEFPDVQTQVWWGRAFVER